MASVSGLAVLSLQLLNERYRPYKGAAGGEREGGREADGWIVLAFMIVFCLIHPKSDSYKYAPHTHTHAHTIAHVYFLVYLTHTYITGVRTITKSGRFQVRSS